MYEGRRSFRIDQNFSNWTSSVPKNVWCVHEYRIVQLSKRVKTKTGPTVYLFSSVHVHHCMHIGLFCF